MSINWGPAVQPQHQKRQPDGGGGRISDTLPEYPGADPGGRVRADQQSLTAHRQTEDFTARHWLPPVAPALTAFSRLYPQVELDLDFSDRLVNLIDEGVDVAIRSGELADSRLIARKLGGFRFVLCASPAYPGGIRRPRLASGIGGAQVHFFRFPATGLIQPWELRGMRLTGDFRSAAVMTVNNIEAAIRLSAAGMGIAYVP
ncbi:LysR substrate-binding domain-containing protein [Klebsiella pneumoniae subsp. pneumoniae]|nr:LysR substrate-binding domain-containing protein [Klebsiella pneumoniae subsp. pneumoniae]